MTKKISHYEIIGKIGAGGMGLVYRARDPRLDRNVAIKFLNAELSADETSAARFVQEAKAASALDHPNICAIYEIDRDENDQLFMVMAHYDGGDLDNVVEDGPVPADEAVRIVRQVADGLAKAHAKGIVHRDIKPSNIMLTADGTPKILDFGLAKVAGGETLTATGASIGSPAFMAPEQVLGDEWDHRVDVWAVGVVLYCLAAGRRPFRGDHPQALMYGIVNEEPQPLHEVAPGIPASVERLILDCMQKEPAKRIGTMAEVVGRLDRITETLASASRTATVSRRSAVATGAKRRSGSPLVKVGAIAAIAVALGTVAWIGLRTLRPSPPPAVRVLVMDPFVTALADTISAGLMASSAEVATLRALAETPGLAPIPQPRETRGGDAASAARAVAADEVIGMELVDTGAEWNVQIVRMKPDGDLIWTSTFSAAHEYPTQLASGIVARLRDTYPQLPASELGAQISETDYASFLRTYRNSTTNDGMTLDTGTALLDSLDAITSRAPDFVDAHIAKVRIARWLFESSRDPVLLNRGRVAAEQAQRVSPSDTRTEGVLFDLAVVAGDLDTAEEIVARTRERDPGGVVALRREAAIARQRGNTARALELMRQVVERRPARGFLSELVEIEYDSGEVQSAREHLNQMLSRFPDDGYAQSKLAEVELLYGDAERAANLYEQIVRADSNVVEITNLGIARSLLGDYTGAANNYRIAVRQAPNDPTGFLNLADCELMAGNRETADSLYRHVLVLIAADANPNDLFNLQMKAQSLAHTGQKKEATATIMDAIAQDKENAWTYYAATVVYAAIGERASALASADKAFTKGVEGRWFQFALFDPLKDDADFQAILASDPAN